MSNFIVYVLFVVVEVVSLISGSCYFFKINCHSVIEAPFIVQKKKERKEKRAVQILILIAQGCLMPENFLLHSQDKIDVSHTVDKQTLVVLSSMY